MVIADGSLATTDMEKAQALLEPFATPDCNDALAISLKKSFPYPPDGLAPTVYDKPIGMCELDFALQTAKLGAMGPDLVPYHFLKNLSFDMKTLLLRLYNLCFASAYVPKAWKTATLLPILKPNKPPDIPSSYRPIALASCTLKTLEKIIARRLNLFLEINNKIPDFQFGFRKGQGCTEALSKLITSIKLSFSQRRYAVCAFLDVRKAFDHTRHEAIAAALRKLRVPSKIYNFCEAYLAGRRLQMTVGNATASQELFIGVPQGGPLSTHLFSAVMCNIPPSGTQFSTPGLYADDTHLLSIHEDLHQAISQLNFTLRHLQFNAITWGMSFDPNKSKIIIFQPRRLIRPASIPSIFYAGQSIPIVHSHTFLGLIMDTHLTWSPHVKELTAACSNRLKLLKYVASRSWGYSQTTLRTLYITLIRAKIQYSLIHFGSDKPSTIRPLELIQNRALRIILGLPPSTAVASMQILANLPPLTIHLQTLQMGHTIKQLARNNTSPSTLLLRDYIPRWRTAPPTEQTGLNLLRRHDLVHLIHAVEPLPRFIPIPSWMPSRFVFNINWLDSQKTNTNPDLLRILGQAIIQDIPEDYIVIYTDGALLPDSLENGIGIYCPSFQVSMRLKLPTGASIFTVELNAIWIAIDWATSQGHQKLAIISDSKSALTAIQHRYHTSILVHQIHALPTTTQIIFIWTPSHVGIPGNTRADALATAALTDQSTSISGLLPYSDILREVLKTQQKSWNLHWKGQTTGRTLYSIFQSAQNVPILPNISRIRTSARHHLACNRAYLAQRLFLLKIKPSPLCDVCLETEDSSHLLLSCKRYNIQRQTLATELNKLGLSLSLPTLLGGFKADSSTHYRIHDLLMNFIDSTIGIKPLIGLT